MILNRGSRNDPPPLRVELSPLEVHISLEYSKDEMAHIEKHLHALAASIVNIERKFMSAFTDLKAAVAAQTTVIDSVVVLIKGLNDPVAMAELKADLDKNTKTLADAVAENTTPPEPPVIP